MLPGFRGRLQAELVKLAPPSVPVEVSRVASHAVGVDTRTQIVINGLIVSRW